MRIKSTTLILKILKYCKLKYESKNDIQQLPLNPYLSKHPFPSSHEFKLIKMESSFGKKFIL